MKTKKEILEMLLEGYINVDECIELLDELYKIEKENKINSALKKLQTKRGDER